jgi:hypothetical protein
VTILAEPGSPSFAMHLNFRNVQHASLRKAIEGRCDGAARAEPETAGGVSGPEPPSDAGSR